MEPSASYYKKALSDGEFWKLVPLPSVGTSTWENPWHAQNLHSRTPSKNLRGEPMVPYIPPYSPPKYIKSLPFITPVPIKSVSPEVIWFRRPPSNDKVYGWDFPSQDTGLSDDSSSGAAKPDQDISALVTDEHVGGISVNIDADTMNNTCDGEFSKPPGDGESSKPPGDGEFNQPPGDVGTIKPLGDCIPFSGSQDVCCARDSSSSSACYMCGEADHFARKCSLGRNCGKACCGNSTA